VKTQTGKTVAEFKQFAFDIAPAARAVLMTRAHEELTRERVDAYVRPIFDGYQFKYGAIYPEKAGTLVESPKDLYLCEEEDRLLNYYEDCDAAHRAHGFTGPKGHCPALIAEHLRFTTESQLIALAAPFFGIADLTMYGDARKKFLDLIIGACIQAEAEAA
jgi:hypothetical protein